MTFDLQTAIDTSTTGIVEVPAGEHAVGNVTVRRDVRISGAGMTASRLRGSLHLTTRGQVVVENLRVTGLGFGTAVAADFAFRTILRNLLLEDVDVGVQVTAGECWTLADCYVLGSKWGIELANEENPDQGDATITNCTFADPGKGLAAIHHRSSGGLRCINNKVLGYDWAYLGEIEGATSDLLLNGCSLEGQRKAVVAMRCQPGGSFENIEIVGNQFASPCPGITANGVHRGVVTGNTANLSGRPFFQQANARGWIVANNIST